jgi:methylenetetrahydrofolate dehydrogenase (NADP+)/methenyltetrahydrofolate cyclohydrolase
MIKPGATIIDFGVNVSGGRVYGDADAESIAAIAGAYTPVPGGTTPVTTMALARNTVTAAYAQAIAAAESRRLQSTGRAV